MYCQNCGSELRQNLVFCNRCGGRVNLELEKFQSVDLPAKKAVAIRNISIVVGFIGVGGIIAIAVLILQLVRRGEISPPAFFLVMILGALVFGIVFLLINQISRLSSATTLNKFSQMEHPESLFEKQNNQLPPHFQPVPNSVTEYTTRNLEKIEREKH
ncbi:MAG: zinc ribbon domain-containing protein [Pyrinomonadaceae bacterium]